MKTARMILLLLVCIFSLFPLRANAIGVEGAIGLWSMKSQGDAGYKGEDLSLEQDLRLGYGTRPFGRIRVDMPLLIPNVYLMATQTKSDGSGNSSTDFVFGDKTFSKAVPLSSELTMTQYDLALFYGIPFLKTFTLGKLNVDAGLNLKVIDVELAVTQSGASESKQYTVPIPMAFLAAQLNPIGGLYLEAEARLIALGSADHFYDFLGRVKYMVLGPAFVAAGYRYEDVQLDRSGLRINMWMGGPFFEIGVDF